MTKLQTSFASVALRWAPLLGALLLSASACGGTSDTEREQPPKAITTKPEVDFYSCESVTAKYEFRLLSDQSSFDVAENIRDKGVVNFYANNDETNPSRALTESEQAKTNPRAPCKCYPDASDAPEGSKEVPAEGGAPSLSGASICEPSPRSVELRSEKPGLIDWGFVWGGSFAPPMDLTDFDGLAVWVKRAAGTEPIAMFASVGDQYTYTSTSVEDLDFCKNEGLLTDACDPFGIGVGFEEAWRLVLLPFDEMAQRGFGKASPLGHVEVENLYAFAFYLPSGVWNVRVDELSLYRKK